MKGLTRLGTLVLLVDFCALLPGCGGKSSALSSPSAPSTYTVGGMVSGISGSGLVLQDNGGNNLPVSANGSFVFPAGIASGGAYSVTVLTQPSSPAQICVVTNGGGTVIRANVTSVAVTCATSSYSVGGTVSGLSGSGLVLQDNGGNNLPVSANGSFAFTAGIASGGAFNVTVFTQPSSPAQTCVVINGGVTVTSANVTSVAVTCMVTATGYFVSTGSMTTARYLQTATLLNDGMVLVAGGSDVASPSSQSYWASAELYNPATGTFSSTGSMTTTHDGHTATLLNNGQVLIAGGVGTSTLKLGTPTGATGFSIPSQTATQQIIATVD